MVRATFKNSESAVYRDSVIRRLELNVKNINRKGRAIFIIPTFIIFAVVVVISRNVTDAFLFEETVKETLLKENPLGGPKFEEVETIDQIWEWTDKTFFHFFLEDEFYTGESTEGSMFDEAFLHINKIVGGFRLIQRRVKDHTCEKSPRFEEFVGNCWGPLTSANEDMDTFKPFGHTGNGYEFVDEGEGVKGYIVDFTLDKAEAHAKLAELKKERWIDLATRDVEIHFNLYNHNINQVLVGRILFPISATTLVGRESDLYSLRLEPKITDLDKTRQALEVIFLILQGAGLCWEIFRIARRLIRGDPLITWFLGFPLIRMLNLVFSLTAIGLWFKYVEDDLLKNYQMPPVDGHFHDLEPLAIELQDFLIMAAITIFTFILCTLEAAKFSDKASFITEVFTKAGMRLVSFIVLFFFVYSAFALSGMMLFGVSIERWSTFDKAFTSLFEITTGEQPLEALTDANAAAPVFYYAFIVLIFFLLFNMFIALLADGYIQLSQEKKHAEMAVNRYSIFDFAREYYRNAKRVEPVFNSRNGITLLRDPSFAEFREISYPFMVKVAEARGFNRALVDQIFRRYSHGHVELIKRATRDAYASTIQDVIRQEFDSSIATGTVKYDHDAIMALKAQVLKRTDLFLEGDSDFSGVAMRAAPVDFDSDSTGESYDSSSYSDESSTYSG